MTETDGALNEEEDEEGASLWDDVSEGRRDPPEILYVIDASSGMTEDDLEEVLSGGGLFEISVAHSVEDAKRAHRYSPFDLMILLGVSIKEVRDIARAFPNLPLSLARPGGWEGFPKGYPPQVVVAQWAAPRFGEFMTAVEDALSRDSLNLIYEETHELLYSAASSTIEVVSAASAELLARLSEFPAERFAIDPRVFEETVAELLLRMGYEVQLTPRSGDKGRDVIAAFRAPAAPVLMLVECKRYAAHRPVGPEPVARVWSRLFDDHANLGMVVTTSSFTPSAHELALSRGYQMTLRDGDDFIAWVRSLGPPPRLGI